MYRNRPAGEAIASARFVHPVTGLTVTVTAVERQAERGVIVLDFRTDAGEADFIALPLDAPLSLNLHCAA